MGFRSSAAAAHRELAAVSAQEDAILATAPQIMRARDVAQDQWERIASGLVQARTLELARSSVRQQLLEVLERDAVSAVVQPATSASSSDLSKPVQAITQVVSFEAQSPDVAYALLDRLAHMQTMHTRLVDLRMTGPGIRAIEHSIRVRVTIEVLAYVAEDAHG